MDEAANLRTTVAIARLVSEGNPVHDGMKQCVIFLFV